MILTKILQDVNFLILRNYHDLHNNIPEYPDDIDLLTDDYNKILNCIKPYLIKIDNPNVGHILNINNKKIKLDIRVIGYNYYDSNWESDMLKKKILYHSFYILDKVNYKYSILYHCLIHKKNIDKKYNTFIQSEFNTLNRNELYLLLEKFMVLNSYKFVKPKDINCFYYNYKPTKMLFLIRRDGLIKYNNIVDYTRTTLNINNYFIDDEGLIIINKDKMLKEFYYEKMKNKNISEEIKKTNDNMCYFIITDYNNYKQSSKEIKNNLRNIFANSENICRNYIHSSDNIDEAYREIDILKSNTLSFRDISTYYQSCDI